MKEVIQRLHASRCKDHISKGILFAASGASLFCIDLSSGKILGQWSPVEPISHIQDLAESEQKPSDQTESLKDDQSKLPNATILAIDTTSDGKHMVSMSGEDKCIRVFKIQEDGDLKLLSER
jgi:tRNA (guanine-N(7)-)-methyltransferase subunit TRM82